jgi:hypothetical protein
MADVFVEWNIETPLSECDVRRLTDDGNGCRDLYKVRLQGSLLDEQGRRLICHFRAPDAESVRMALRCVGAHIDLLWTGTIHDKSKRATGNVVVEYTLSRSVLADTDKAIDATATEWRETYGFQLARAIISRDRKRMICLYEAPDAASIRLAQFLNDSPTTTVWPYRRLGAQSH